MTVPPADDPDSGMSVAVYSGEMIEVAYTAVDDRNGGYVIRKAAGAKDISGDFTAYAETVRESVNGAEVTLKGDGENWSLAIWTKNGYAYAVGTQNAPMAREAILSLVEQIE